MEMKEYMAKIASDPSYDEIWERCMNRHPQCAQWVYEGECDANPSYMKLNCAPLCKSCDLLDMSVRCPRDESLVDALLPGDLHRMFERIIEDDSLDLTILSRPSENDARPWVITIDDFVSQEECDRLIEMGAFEGYERSTDVGGLKFDGSIESIQSNDRTSHNAWCSNSCYNDPITVNVMNKISNLTGVSVENSEHLQLLRYQKGQFYKTQ
jgi:prolyl 4-hydroxylase